MLLHRRSAALWGRGGDGPHNPQALNRYSYVLNNPLTYTDPSGHHPVAAAIGGLFAAAGIAISAPAIAAIAAAFTVLAIAVFLEDPGNRAWLSEQINAGITNVDAFVEDLSHIVFAKDKKPKKQARRSPKDRSTDFPSWAKGEQALPGESPREAAERLMNKRYGEGNWSPRKSKEYSEIKKHFQRR